MAESTSTACLREIKGKKYSLSHDIKSSCMYWVQQTFDLLEIVISWPVQRYLGRCLSHDNVYERPLVAPEFFVSCPSIGQRSEFWLTAKFEAFSVRCTGMSTSPDTRKSKQIAESNQLHTICVSFVFLLVASRVVL